MVGLISEYKDVLEAYISAIKEDWQDERALLYDMPWVARINKGFRTGLTAFGFVVRYDSYDALKMSVAQWDPRQNEVIVLDGTDYSLGQLEEFRDKVLESIVLFKKHGLEAAAECLYAGTYLV